MPDVEEPPDDPPLYAEPDPDAVKCKNQGQPDFNDCVHAFGALNNFPDQRIKHGKKDGVWWAGVSTPLSDLVRVE